MSEVREAFRLVAEKMLNHLNTEDWDKVSLEHGGGYVAGWGKAFDWVIDTIKETTEELEKFN